MTDDDQAAAVQEALAGVHMCPHCGGSMHRVHITSDYLGKGVPGWFCNGVPPDSRVRLFNIREVTHEIWLFDDGTKIKPPAGESSMTFLVEYDIDLGPADQAIDKLLNGV